MKFTVLKQEFIQQLSTANSIINPKSPLSIFLNFYIEAFEDGSIIILSYNGENGMKLEITGEVKTPGKISLQAKKLLDIVSRMPGDKIVMELKDDEEHRVSVHPEDKENPMITLNGISGDTYPIFSEFNWDNYIRLSQETLLEQITSTAFSVTHDSAKPAFSGTYIEENQEMNSLTFVSTDGKRLSAITREYEEKKGEIETSIIIPEKALKAISSVLNTGDVLFSVNNNQAFFKIGNVYVFTNLVDGNFPNYQEVIPKEEINIINIESQDFLKALELVSVMTEEESGKTVVKINDSEMVIVSNHAIYGEASQTVDIEYNGNPIQIAFSYKTMKDYLKIVQGKKLHFVVNSTASAMLLRPEEDEDFIYIAMPLRQHD